jgi:outer membrane biosynthesis protein TonB
MTPAVARQLAQMPELPEPTSPHASGRRPRRLPATGLPAARDDRKLSSVVSLALHVLVIMLIIGPAVTHTGIVIERPQGAGGLGPAGGGGGGRRGSGGVPERVTYVRPAPPPVAAPAPAAVIPPPAPIVQPKPVPPPEVKLPEPAPPAVKPEVRPEAKSADATAPTPGTGGGTGSDGSSGTGPGSGGGVGSGVGTGRGAGTGPGTGGGVQANYPPEPTEVFIPPMPFPAKLRGVRIVAEFDVDETGKVLSYVFTPSGDRGYDKRVEEVIKGTRFRPGHTPDGKPIRMKAQIAYELGG